MKKAKKVSEFATGSAVRIHGTVWKVLSTHSKGKSPKVTDGEKVTFKRAVDATPVLVVNDWPKPEKSMSDAEFLAPLLAEAA
jgi:hypothetical protein